MLFRNSKIEDRVWSLLYGWGEILEIVNNKVGVVFYDDKNRIRYFNFDGRMNTNDRVPTLFLDKLDIKIPTVKFDLLKFLKSNFYKSRMVTVVNEDKAVYIYYNYYKK